jgi:hypothetical protein
VGTLRFTGTS